MCFKRFIMTVNNKMKGGDDMNNQYNHISGEDLDEAKEIYEIIRGLDDLERAMVSTYAAALRDRKMYAESA